MAKNVETKLEKEEKVFNVERKPGTVFYNTTNGKVKMDPSEEVKKV